LSERYKRIRRRSHIRRVGNRKVRVRETEYLMYCRRGLVKYGYSVRKPTKERRKALFKAAMVETPTWVLGQLQALMTIAKLKGSALETARIRQDMRWVKELGERLKGV